MEYKYTGIILSKYDIGEADRLYSIYTLEGGKIQAKAVGVRKLGAKLAGFLENFVLADLSIVKKNGMGKITASIVENSFANLRTDLDSILLVSRMIKIFQNLIGLGEKDENVFNILLDYLAAMDEAVGRKSQAEVISVGFLFQILKLSGYEIDLKKCIVCGSMIDSHNNFFDLEKGGVVCRACVGNSRENMSISANGIKLLRLISSNKIRSLLKIKMEKEEAGKVRKIIEDFCRRVTS